MAAQQHKDITCRTSGCPNAGKVTRVWASAVTVGGWHDWPHVTCSACGRDPWVLTEDDVQDKGAS